MIVVLLIGLIALLLCAALFYVEWLEERRLRREQERLERLMTRLLEG